MKQRTLVIFITLILMLTVYQPAVAETTLPAQAEQSSSPRLLCPPGVYLNQNTACSPLGPSDYLTRMAEKGLALPAMPLSASHLDPALGWVPYTYALMKESGAPIYPTLDDAISRSNATRVIGPGELKYISYIQVTETEGEIFFQLRSGGWMVASEGISSRVSLPSSFRGGLTFQRTPQNHFGWVIPIQNSIETKRTPGYENDDWTGHLLYQYDVVQVYAEQEVAGMDWYLVGPDEWVEGRMIGRVYPNTTHPEGVTNGRWIEINLYEQTLSVYDGGQLVFATLMASGIEPFWTRPGLFQIYKKHESAPMSGAFEADRSDFYYLDDVPYIMYYDGARALHAAYWRYRLGFPQSHGCVNLSIADAHWIFDWANEGDWVYVWDPSGKTPTDEAAYAGGGAP